MIPRFVQHLPPLKKSFPSWFLIYQKIHLGFHFHNTFQIMRLAKGT